MATENTPNYQNPWLLALPPAEGSMALIDKPEVKTANGCTALKMTQLDVPKAYNCDSAEILLLQFPDAFSTYKELGGNCSESEIKELLDDRLLNLTPAESEWLDKTGQVDLVIFPELEDCTTPEDAVEVITDRAEVLQSKLPEFGGREMEPWIAHIPTDGRVSAEDIVGLDRNEPKIAFIGRKPEIRYGGTVKRQDTRSISNLASIMSLSPDENFVRLLKIIDERDKQDFSNSDKRMSALYHISNSAKGGLARHYQMNPLDNSVLESGVNTDKHQVYVLWSDINTVRHNDVGAIE